EQPSLRFVALVQPISWPICMPFCAIVIWLTFTNEPSGDFSVTATNVRDGIVVPREANPGAPSRTSALLSTHVILAPCGSRAQVAGASPAVSFASEPTRFIAEVQPKDSPESAATHKA